DFPFVTAFSFPNRRSAKRSSRFPRVTRKKNVADGRSRQPRSLPPQPGKSPATTAPDRRPGKCLRRQRYAKILNQARITAGMLPAQVFFEKPPRRKRYQPKGGRGFPP